MMREATVQRALMQRAPADGNICQNQQCRGAQPARVLQSMGLHWGKKCTSHVDSAWHPPRHLLPAALPSGRRARRAHR